MLIKKVMATGLTEISYPEDKISKSNVKISENPIIARASGCNSANTICLLN